MSGVLWNSRAGKASSAETIKILADSEDNRGSNRIAKGQAKVSQRTLFALGNW